MAYFAKLDGNNIVTTVIAVDDNTLGNAAYPASEQIGVSFLNGLYGPMTWKQTSRDGSFRKNAAAVGYTYNSSLDAFIAPKPYPSWTLNNTSGQWQAPVAYPTDGFIYLWNEPTLYWVKMA